MCVHSQPAVARSKVLTHIELICSLKSAAKLSGIFDSAEKFICIKNLEMCFDIIIKYMTPLIFLLNYQPTNR